MGTKEAGMVRKALVTGAGGFIGFHMVRYLKAQGYVVRAADIKAPEFAPTEADEFELTDLRDPANCERVTRGMDEVYQLAADMGGIGYISSNHADVARHNVLINAHMLESSSRNGVDRYFYSSSACIYPMYRQLSPDVEPLKEEDAYPADPEEGYGWEKLFSEKLCEYYAQDHGIETRVARFHNVYGPLGTYDGGREKAPAAVCRKVALAADGDEIEIWGDGQQTRSFLYVDDCVEGIHRLTMSDHREPLNLGSDELVTIDGLVDLVSAIAGKTLVKRHDTTKPQGVRGRNSDNGRLSRVLGWVPARSLQDGLTETYAWISSVVVRAPAMADRSEDEVALTST
jgi:GDP-D-mannose 3',5'-epimerase